MKAFGLFEYKHNRKLARMKVAVAVMGGIGLASAVGGAVSTNAAANTAADAATNATNAADATQLQMYNQTRDDQAPYRQAGYTALNSITQDQANGTGFAAPFNMNSFYSDPGYQFTLQQGQNAINNSASARGGTLNGGTLKALGQYTTGLANQTYGDAYNRYLSTSNQQYNQLAGVAGLGQNSLNTTAQAGTSAANQISGNQFAGIQNAGNARASGYLGIGNSINSGLSTIGNMGNTYAGYNFLKGLGSGGQQYGLPGGGSVNYPTVTSLGI